MSRMDWDDDRRTYREERKRRQKRRRRRRRLSAIVRLAVLLIAVYGVSRYVLPEMSSEAVRGGVSAFAGGAADLGESLEVVREYLTGWLQELMQNLPAGGEEASSGDEGDAENASGETASTASEETTAAAAETGVGASEDAQVAEKMEAGPYYFYHQMTPEDQKIYRILYAGVMEMQTDITFSTTDYENVFKIEDLMLADHPEIFWYGGEGSTSQYAYKLVMHPTYTIDASERTVREQQIAEETAAFLARIGENETSYERLATAFAFVAGNCTYVTGAPDDQNICSSLINHESVCAGYARGVQYLLQQLDIECLYVWGRVEDRGDHAWNIVNLDGTYYQSDVTFGDRSFTDSSILDDGMPDALAFEYGYLCMNDEEALRDRVIDMELTEGVTLPSCTSTEMSYYRRHGWYFPEYTEEVWADIERELNDGASCWRYQFGTREAYESFLAEINDNRFARMALEIQGLSSIRTYTSPNDMLYAVSGWIPG